MSWDETIYLKRKNCARQQIAVAIMKTIRLQQKYNKGENTLGKKDLISAEKIAATFIDIECAG